MKLSEIAKLLGAELTGDDDPEIVDVGKIESATSQQITFIANPAYEKYFHSTKAGAVIVSKDFQPSGMKKSSDKPVSILRVEEPYLSFLKILEVFSPVKEHIGLGIHNTAVISDSAKVSRNETRIGANCYIGHGCKIGDRVTILPNTVIMNNVSIGNNVLIYPNVTIYDGCKLGDSIIVHSGTVIGSDGFGQARTNEGKYLKIPQKGIVVIEDDVEIGSNCSIDRATIGETLICNGVKLDNQIQIAHNVVIGENTVIAAHTGIAGSTKIGKNCMIGGKVGIVGHLEICDNVIITAATNVSKSIGKPGIYSGYRALEQKEELKKEALVRNIVDIVKRIDKLEKKSK